ncbi:MAG: deoxynucleoside kinase [Chloroflexi bacterium]|nr:deoxynucleoside kinase [Chloroflexota bacterium]
MGKLITVVGASGVGKTSLVQALSRAGNFAVAYEQHIERPFQTLFKQDESYCLANQMDYLLLRAEQERGLRAEARPALMDGGLDLDFHGFTRLFHARGWLSDSEFDLCRRFYELTRQLLPPPDLIVYLTASEEVIRRRLISRQRINIASAEDTARFSSFLGKWLSTMPIEHLLQLDVSNESLEFTQSLPKILARL